MGIRAVVFDLDGTLADTEELHFQAFAEAFAERGGRLTRTDYYERYIGYDDRECARVLISELGLSGAEADAEARRLAERKRQRFEHHLVDRDHFYPGASQLILALAAHVPLAVATGALRGEAEILLSRAGVRDCFAVVVGADEVARGKPAPDLFFEALERLNRHVARGRLITAEQAMVIEDTPGGIQAARSAGMRVIAVAHTMPAEELAEAERVYRSVAEISPTVLLGGLDRTD